MTDTAPQQPVEPVCPNPACGHWLFLDFLSTRAELAGHIMESLPAGTVWATSWPEGLPVRGFDKGMVLHVPHEWTPDEEDR